MFGCSARRAYARSISAMNPSAACSRFGLIGSIKAVHFQVGNSIRQAGGHNADYAGIELNTVVRKRNPAGIRWRLTTESEHGPCIRSPDRGRERNTNDRNLFPMSAPPRPLCNVYEGFPWAC